MTTENHVADGLLSRNEYEITDQELEEKREDYVINSNQKYCEDVAHLCHLATELIIHNGFSLSVSIFTWGLVTVYAYINGKAFILFDFAKGDDVKEKSKLLTMEYLKGFITGKG